MNHLLHAVLRVCAGAACTLLPGATLFAQLSGTYVIDAGGGGDYSSVGAAFTALMTQGVSGPVIMEVASGTYTSRYTLSGIPGSSATNPVTFRGQALDSSLAIWSYGTQNSLPWGGHNSLLRLSGAQFVTFEHLTMRRSGTGQYANVIYIDGSTSDITVRHCRLSGGSNPDVNIYSRNVVYCADNTAQTGMAFRNNRIEGGNLGFSWDGNTRLDEVALEGNVINAPRNLFEALGGSLTVNGNQFYATQTSNALYLNNMSCPVQVRGNTFRSTSSTTPVYIYGVDGVPAAPVIFSGNMVIGPHGSLTVKYCDFVDMTHNSFSGRVHLGSGNNGIRSRNNIFLSTTTGSALSVSSGSVSVSDHNCFFGGSGVTWSGGHQSVGSLNAATGMDANSKFVDPMYMSTSTNLHLQAGSPCAGIGLAIAGEVSDIDGEIRPRPALSNPDLGADETDEQCIPLSGTYTIGPSSGTDFATFGAAINKISGCGVGGAVVFEVEDGTYTERLVFGPIPGSSAANTVTFRSASLDSSAVTIRYAASSSANNYVVALRGVAHLRLTHLTMSRYFSDNYRRVVLVSPNAGSPVDVVIDRSKLTSSGSGSNGTDAALIGRTNGAGEARLQVSRTLLRGGSYGVYWDASGAADELTISGGKVEYGKAAIVVDDVSGAVNIMGEETLASGGNGVEVRDCTGAITITKNRIYSPSGYYGIYYQNNNPVAPGRGLVANNEVIGGNKGLYLSGSNSRSDVVYNSVSMGNSSATAFKASGAGVDVNVLNNVFRALGPTPADISMTGLQMDRNCFYGQNGLTRIHWGMDYTDLPALFAATGTNANSVIADPHFFYEYGDLHAYGMEIDAAASPFALVNDDFDGEPRDPSTPDMGAHEFQPQLWNGTFNACSTADIIFSTGSGVDQWIYKDRMVVAQFNDNGQVLGVVRMDVYVNNAALRQSLIGQYYMDRNWHLYTHYAMAGASSVRLFFSGDEFSSYAATDPLVTVVNDAGVAHYAGQNENCDLPDNPAGYTWTPIFPTPSGTEPRIAASGGTSWYNATLGDDGELYITTMGLPLPVELLSFTGARIGDGTVQLNWSTASERDNDHFEVWRMVDGEEQFVEVGRVQGHGNSQQILRYTFNDPNRTQRISYYKLRQVDHGGAASVSPVIAVEGGTAGAVLEVYPIPARDRLHVVLDRSRSASFELFDISGRLQRRWPPDAELRVDGVPRGVHILKARMLDGSVYQAKCIIE